MLVCTADAKIYAELTGVFDRFVIINDASLLYVGGKRLARARHCFHASLCLDLEPNSLLAAVFTMLTGAGQRMGLVKPEQPARALAYTSAISFNPAAPIYIYYDQICERFGAAPVADDECRDAIRASCRRQRCPPPPTKPLASLPSPPISRANA